MKVAIVCDWLVTYAGAERVLEQILELYPEADLFAVVDFIKPEERGFIKNKPVTTTFIQNLPKAKTKYRSYLPFMPIAIEQLDVSAYDLVISSSHCVAKGVLTGPNQMHISYVHSPIRYAWDLQHQYLRESRLDHGLKGKAAKAILHYMRMWDVRTSNGVDYFIANSQFIAKRIWKCYRRKAEVIYPPVDIDSFAFCNTKEGYYMTASRMVPYKKIDIIVQAFTQMPDKKLIVIGTGPDFDKIKAKAGPNVQMMGYQPNEVLREKMQKAKAFVFAAEEDFGIVPVEAQACGTPVIAYGKGGALETIKDLNKEKCPTGLFFYEQSAASIVEAIKKFEGNIGKFDYAWCRSNAENFSKKIFRENFLSCINRYIAQNKG
jgi:glycosyltransferase involved in cell wall biosynthesis